MQLKELNQVTTEKHHFSVCDCTQKTPLNICGKYWFCTNPDALTIIFGTIKPIKGSLYQKNVDEVAKMFQRIFKNHPQANTIYVKLDANHAIPNQPYFRVASPIID
ncbi:hypothetical protein N9Y92_01685 [Chlamydiales bacterium]|nr:hypothetical protein [Chlamydiales bacterium]